MEGVRPRGRAWSKVLTGAPGVGLVLAVALLARLAVFAVNEPGREARFLVPDSASYIAAAASLHDRGAITDAQGRPAWGRVPGYPALLALLFSVGAAAPERLSGAIVLQCLLGTMVVAIAAPLSRALPGRTSPMPVLLLLALEPSLVAYSNTILSEMLYTLGLLVAWHAWSRHLETGRLTPLAGSALAVGCLPLVRPIGEFLPLALGPLVFWGGARGSRRAWALALFASLALFPELAWCWRNEAALGSFALHSTGPWGQAIFAHDVETRVGRPDLAPAAAPRRPWEDRFGEDQGLAPGQAAAAQRRYFHDTVVAHPGAALAQLASSGLLLMGVPDSRLARILLDSPPPVPEGTIAGRLLWMTRLGPFAPLLALGMLASVGGLAAIPWLLAGWRRYDPVTRGTLAFALAVVLYHWVLSSFVTGQGERYRVPLIPCLALLLSAGVGLWRERTRAARPVQATNAGSPNAGGAPRLSMARSD